MSYRLREARTGERFQILGLARNYWSVAGLPFEFDPAHVSMTVADYIDDPEKLALVLVGRAGVVGALLASVMVSPIAPVRIATELAWWVDPEARGRASLKMLPAYEAWAAEKGCQMIGIAGRGDPRLARVYKGRGFASHEDHYLKVLRKCQ